MTDLMADTHIKQAVYDVMQNHKPQANKIYQCIPKMISDIKGIAKTHQNQNQGYYFRGIDDVLAALSPVLAKHGCFIATEVLDYKLTDRQTKQGGLMIHCVMTVKFKIYADDSSFVEVTTIGEGSDSGDKACNKAMSSAFKYMAFQLFCITTEDQDADSESASPEFSEPLVQKKSFNIPKSPKLQLGGKHYGDRTQTS